MKRVLWLVVLLAAASAHAAEPNKKLATTEASIKAAQSESKALSIKAGTLKEEKEKLQKTLVELASGLQKKERELIVEERQLATIRTTTQEKQAAIAERKKRLSTYTHTLLRLSEMPPEAMLLLPELSDHQIESAAALKMVTAQASQETLALEEDIETLRAAEKKQTAVIASIKTLVEEQKKGQGELAERLKERDMAYKTADAERAAKQDRLKALSKEAASLKDLMNKLNENEKTTRTEKPSERKGDKKSLRSFTAYKGKIRSPVAGRIAKQFGQETSRGDKGVVIESRDRATVTAPFDGEVMFTGPFMNYGPIVIIRHRDDFYSLIAGLETIHARLGEFLLEGEPIGAMGSDASPQLYFELRKGTQPIDPAAWVSGL
jgi:murein hydrolase activator